MRYKITLSYNGSCFNGWQIQPNAPSIQETLEKGLSMLLRSDISVTGAGRTDTGVNAMGYVAHFDSPVVIDDTTQLGYKLNAISGNSIVIHSIENVDDEFHARYDASRREYTYFLHRVKDPFIANFSYWCPFSLDIAKMNEAASLMVGTHDFSCFEKGGSDTKSSICTVTGAEWRDYVPTHLEIMKGASLNDRSREDYLYFKITADRFLRNMVRATVGTLLEVGCGKRSVEDFGKLILPVGDSPEEGKTIRRSLAGESVPGHALFLSGVVYPEY